MRSLFYEVSKVKIEDRLFGDTGSNGRSTFVYV